MCALLAKGVAGARSTVGDVREGPHGGGLVAGPPRSGALADGVITRVEVEEAVQATAVPRTTQPGAFVREGYGLVDALTLDQAMRVLFGEAPRPERPQEDAWQGAMDAARDAVWDHVPDCPNC